jgi:hypothetical protein
MAPYPFDKFQVTITGPSPDGSFSLKLSTSTSAKESITISKGSNSNVMTPGADSVMHSLIADKFGKFGTATIQILKTSSFYGNLSRLFKQQTSSSSWHGKNTITICDMNGNVVATCEGAAFKKHGSDSIYARWMFDVAIIDP